MEYQTDHHFLEKLKQKDNAACKQLYLQYADAMYNICLRILLHQEEAEDALQEAFIKIFNSIHQFRNESSIGSWVKKIVTNTCLNVLRKKKMYWVELDENADLNDPDEDTENNDSIHYSIEEIKQALEELPNGYRLVFNLFIFEEYTHLQIAELLEITESTAKSQLFKAKRKIKSILLLKNKKHG